MTTGRPGAMGSGRVGSLGGSQNVRLLTVATVFALAACSSRIEGPGPTVNGLVNLSQPGSQPARLCNAQGGEGWGLELSGSGFAPLLQQVATGAPRVVMPMVAFEREGASVSLAPEFVTVVSSSKLALRVPMGAGGLTLEPGEYAVQVTNPHGASFTLPGALRVVPPPVLTAVPVPQQGLARSVDNTLIIEGQNFRVNEPPTVVLSRSGSTDFSPTGVQALSPTQVRITLPASTQEGTYDVEVLNPEGCSATLPRGLNVRYVVEPPPPPPVPLGTLLIEPRFGWARRDQPMTLHNLVSNPQAQRPFTGVPQIFLVAPLKSSPSTWLRVPLRRVAFINGNRATAVVPGCTGNAELPVTDPNCPNGIQPGGPYALEVRDPSGAEGQVSAGVGFSVVEAIPTITSLEPAAITTSGLTSSPLVVRGNNFGSMARISLLSPQSNGNLRACRLPQTGTQSTTELRATVPTSIPSSECVEFTSTGTRGPAAGGLSLTPGLYAVRVQAENGSLYTQYSGLIVTRTDFRPTNVQPASPSLNTVRGNFPLVVATDDRGEPYLYALGGSNGPATLDSVELAPIHPSGDLGVFSSSPRMVLPKPLRGHAAVVRTVPGDTSYVFILGGYLDNSNTVNEVWRAQVLRSADAPVLLPPQSASGGNLPAGTFYYRVSAVLNSTDTKNPGGETLASEEDSVTVDGSSRRSVSLQWACVPNAERYRIYRTVSASDSPGTQRLLTEVLASGCTGVPLKATYADDGTRSLTPDEPLPAGALGRWRQMASLVRERGQATAQIVGDELYVVGGYCRFQNGSACLADDSYHESLERASFTTTSADLGTFDLTDSNGWLNTGRRRHSMAMIDATTAPGSFTSGNGSDVWLLVAGGDTSGSPFSSIEVARVRTSAGNVSAPNFEYASYNNTFSLHGGWAYVINDRLFLAGTNGNNNGTALELRFSFACGDNNALVQCSTNIGSSFNSSLSSANFTYQSASPRFLAGSALFRGIIYVAGGFRDNTPIATEPPTNTLERLVY
jgi:hypothetical protein